MPNQHLVSIILPVLNMANLIKPALNSILNQNYTSWELLVIDDGSTDNIQEIVDSFNEPRFRILRNEKNMGIPSSLNLGIKAARGAFIARMDGDDIMFPNRLEIQINTLLANPEIQVVGSTAIAIDIENKLVGIIDAKVPESVDQLVLKGHCFLHPTVMARADWYKSNLYSEELSRCEDYELWIRTYSPGIFKILETPLLFYRNPGTIPWWKYRYIRKKIILSVSKNRNRISNTIFLMVISKTQIKSLLYPLLQYLNFLNPILPIPQKMHETYNTILKESIKSPD